MGKYLTRELPLPFSSLKLRIVFYRISKCIYISSPTEIRHNAHLNSHVVRNSSLRQRLTCIQNHIHLVFFFAL